MNLATANKEHLEVTFLPTAEEATRHVENLTRCGRKVVAVVEELLPGATLPLHLVVVKPAVRVVGPEGIENKLKGGVL